MGGSPTNQKIKPHYHRTMKSLPPSHVDSPFHFKWLARIAELEAEGCDTSDAQSIADIELAITAPQNRHNATTRTAFCDFVDYLAKAGEIPEKLAFRATL